MMRIITGSARGRRLAVPGAGTRPTSDRVREALFSALDARVDFTGLQVLDLYAGSGALALEALSRGASGALLVESDARAARVITANITATGLRGVHVRRSTVAAALAKPAPRRFDLVFADPPYSVPDAQVAAALEALAAGWLAAEALVVVERASRGAATPWPEGYGDVAVKRYGETRIEIATCYGLGS
ncbi:16S rRNA (guanine(966)-N(2))-methyltransferase RsmD [Tomitella gaofuii]|uniref:16S rRNA (guanine(966)-N(2))-methyltransferase RsmD n=1 Tax=Tomitella gaofuii TaxID=2760083 RepID=UPI0015F7F636|nr:16S rRNA (guanine(966)-N(2))-methyltransferase RsmD [Tomitella gaofuii]